MVPLVPIMTIAIWAQNKVGLSFSLPIIRAEWLTPQVKQAQYNFVGASEHLESAHRSVVQTVRSSAPTTLLMLVSVALTPLPNKP